MAWAQTPSRAAAGSPSLALGAERAGRSCPEPLSLPVDSHFIPGIRADLTKCSSVCVAHQLAMKDERGEHAR